MTAGVELAECSGPIGLRRSSSRLRSALACGKLLKSFLR